MQEKNMGHICPIGRSWVKQKIYILWMKTNHYPNKITFHSVTIIPMTSFTLKSTTKLRSFLHFRYSIVIPRFIPHANKAQL